jgi:hypothetical protein
MDEAWERRDGREKRMGGRESQGQAVIVIGWAGIGK